MSKKYHIHTFGCQMNVHDSEKISGIMTESGLEETSRDGKPDIIVLNTCSIREKAAHKFYSDLGRLKKAKKHNPDLKIAVAGCIAQQDGKSLFKRFPYIDFVFGPNNLDSVQEWIDTGVGNIVSGERITDNVSRKTVIHDNPDYHNMLIPAKREGQVRAWTSIMYGCDNFCSYCVVPYTRGRERSRPAVDIYNEVRSLAEKGFKEVTLLGQNVNSYGKSLNEDFDFPDLLRKIDDVDEIKRIRFVTSHPKDFSSKLIDSMSELPRVCNHLHLPLQAGSDRILQLMNRQYSYNEYADKVKNLRAAIEDIAITSDIIVGFPGETDEDFKKTLHALSEVRYDGIFAFKYSRRPGTKALDLDNHVDESIKSERLKQVLDLQEKITYENNLKLEGRTVEVLVEGSSENDHSRMTGRTGTNKIVNFSGSINLVGKVLKIRIEEAKLHSLNGSIPNNNII